MGHVALGLGLDLDRVFVCGLAEGLFPTRVHDDSLLPDADRRATDGALPLRAARVDDDHRRLLAGARRAQPASACCSSLAATCAAPPNGCRRGSWPSASTAADVARLPEDLGELHADWYAPVPSFAAGLARASSSPPPSRSTGCARCSTTPRDGGAIDDHELARVDRALRSRRRHRRRRASSRPSPASTATSPATTSRASPTARWSCRRRASQTYAYSPHDYLLDYVLRVEIPELPEERYEITPLDKGSLVHETLDVFLAEVLARPEGAPAPDAAVARRRPRPAPRDRRGAHGGRTRRRAAPVAGCSGTATGGASSPSSTASSPRTTTCEPARACAPIATELRFGFPDGAPAGRHRRSPTGGRCASGAPPTASTSTDGGVALDPRLQDRPADRRPRRRSHRRRPPAAAPRVRARGAARRSDPPTRRSARPTGT